MDESAMLMLVRATVELLMRTSVALPIGPAVEALMDSVMMRPIAAAAIVVGPLTITATELRVRAAIGLLFTVSCAATGKAALKPALFNSRVADLSAMRLLAGQSGRRCSLQQWTS